MYNCIICADYHTKTEIGFNWTDIRCDKCGVLYSYLNNNDDINNKCFIRSKNFNIEIIDNIVIVVDNINIELESKHCENLLKSIEYMKIMFDKYKILSVYL